MVELTWGLPALDSRYVNITGDTMTGTLTVPTIIGGTGTTSDLTLQTTSGVGATGADMHFLVGNNGATEAITVLNNGNVGIGTTGPTDKLSVVAGGSGIQSGMSVTTYNSNTALPSYLEFDKSHSNTVGSLVTTVDQESLGTFNAGGVNTSNAIARGARIRFIQDGTAGVSWVPAMISFQTSDGTADAADRLTIKASGNVGIGTTAPTNLLSLSGQAARTIWTERNVTAATAGLNLTLRVGGAVVGGTDLGGGILTIAGGISTGTGTSSVLLQTCPAGSTGTADNTLATMLEVTGNKFSVFGVTAVVRPTALTPTGTYTLNTGDAGSDTEITLMRTRINELETKLQSLGLVS